jgi:hypothetical protein
LSVANGGVFRRRDLLAWDVTDANLQGMFRRGWWTRLRHGVYVDTATLLAASPRSRHLLHLAAAVSAAEEVTLAFGPSAALLHRLPLPYEAPDEIHIVREARQDTRSMNRRSKHPLEIPAMRVTSHDLSGCASEMVDGIACISRLTAAVTAGPNVSFTRAVGLFDSVLWGGLVTVEEIRAQIECWSYLGRQRTLLDALNHSRAGAQTYLETLSRVSLVRQGIPEPILQVPIHDQAGLVGIVDMLWSDWRVIGEADGAVKYETREDVIREKRREDRLRALGFSVVRWMWEDIVNEPARVAEQIRRAARRVA